MPTAGSNLSSKAIKLRIKEIKKQRQTLLVELEELEKEVENRQYCSVNARNDANLSSVPSVILLHILQLAQTGSSGYSVPFEFQAIHVCSRWRHLVLGTPLLWSNIKLRSRNAVRPAPSGSSNQHERTKAWWKDTAVLQLYKARFGNVCGLDVVLDFEGWEDYFRILTPYAPRFRSLHLSSPSHQPSPDIHQLLRYFCAPLLEYLRVDCPPAQCQFSVVPNPPYIFLQGAPALSIVDLTCGVGQCWLPPLQTVTTISLRSTTEIIALDVHLRDALASMPNLINLSLELLSLSKNEPDLSFYRSPRSSLSLIAAPVQWLRLSSPSVIPWLRKNVNFPHLKTVELYKMDPGDILIPTDASHWKPFGFVEKLVIRDCSSFGIVKYNIVLTFPLITTLVLDEQLFDHTSKIAADTTDRQSRAAGPRPYSARVQTAVRRFRDGEGYCPQLMDLTPTVKFPRYDESPKSWPFLANLILMNVEFLGHQRSRDDFSCAMETEGVPEPPRDTEYVVVVPVGTKAKYRRQWTSFRAAFPDSVIVERRNLDVIGKREWD